MAQLDAEQLPASLRGAGLLLSTPPTAGLSRGRAPAVHGSSATGKGKCGQQGQGRFRRRDA